MTSNNKTNVSTSSTAPPGIRTNMNNPTISDFAPEFKRNDFQRKLSLHRESSIDRAEKPIIFIRGKHEIGGTRNTTNSSSSKGLGHDNNKNQEFCVCREILNPDNMIHDDATKWNVDDVSEISGYIKIERCHEYINDSSPNEIAKRITTCFEKEKESFSVHYDNEKAVATAELIDNKRLNHCKFFVRLFKAKDSPSILVECQRRTGCSVQFHTMAMKVLHAAKGCEYKQKFDCAHLTIPKEILDKCPYDPTDSICCDDDDENEYNYKGDIRIEQTS